MEQPALPFNDPELKRVTSRIARQILAFCQATPGRFHMADLRGHLLREGIEHAPASPDRIMRHLRACRVLNYRVIDRSKSLYEVIP